VSQIAEEAAAERVIPHVLHDAAAVGVGMSLLHFPGSRHWESLQHHFLNGGVPDRIDDGLVREHGIAVDEGRLNETSPLGEAPPREASRRSQNRPPPLKQLDGEYNHGDDEQKVNHSAQGIRCDQTQQPQNQRNYKDCPKHLFLKLLHSECREGTQMAVGNGDSGRQDASAGA